MDLNKVLETINQDREKTEAAWTFCLWDEPELFEDYKNVNDGNDKTLKNDDAIFYFKLGKALYQKGFRTFDELTLETFLTDKPGIKKKYDEFGGWRTICELKSLVNISNEPAYFDQIQKMNNLSTIAKKYNELFMDVGRFKNASSEDVYNTFELLNNTVTIATSEKVDDLVITDSFVDGLQNGDNLGFSYNRYSPLLNYITLGMAYGLFMLAGHSGTGKSSFAFANFIMSLHYSNIKCAIISNEMEIETYKVLLLEHILTQDMNYWGLTRKQIRMGKWTDEQAEMIERAKEISREKYSDIKFVKLYGNSTTKILKYLRKLKSSGTDVVLLDTFKVDDNIDVGSIWMQLVLDSRKLDSECRRLKISCITTYQLALHSINQRYLDATCLSSAKQIKEVYETQVYMRQIWDDEFPGEKYDIKPWKYNKDNKKIKESITLDPSKKYVLLFIDKTRSDEDKIVLIYEWLAHFNTWKELGFAKVTNTHGGF